MKQVIIGMKDGKPYVISSPKKIEVVFREEKRRSLRKVWRTMVYRVKSALRG
ncbi:hypothetical protein [Paenibacillus cremeus]|uniref:hypothetical protein n=1 Tax=Paenibacillus cremeus TaxID=2163881 RepID=UPI00164423B7|nr:hypothetical protein [Paenibacillus cremeus]